MGLTDVVSGDVLLDGRSLLNLATSKMIAQGIGYVAQDRELCPDLSVRDNLLVALYANGLPLERIETAYKRFPRLQERAVQRAGSLSGGERKILAFARIMLLRPAIYLIDEPTEGLMPSAVGEIGELIGQMRDTGAAILLVEQNLDLVRMLSKRVYLMNVGRIEKCVDELTKEDQARYLGV
jgi:branched-chain amino acid transport system ATP-binding protein